MTAPAELDERLAALWDLWSHKRPDARLPSRGDFDPLEMVRLLPFVFLVDVLERKPLALRYRLIGTGIVNAVGWNTALSYEVDWVPSQRMVVDLADFDASTFIHTTGQSGHAFHPDYDSMIEMWTDGTQAAMPWSRQAVETAAVDTLTIHPAG